MPIDSIHIDTTITTATQAANLKRLTQMARDFQDAAQRMLDIMSHNYTGTDFTQIETLCGLKAGDGQKTFDIINGSIGAINGTMQNANIRDLGQKFV